MHWDALSFVSLLTRWYSFFSSTGIRWYTIETKVKQCMSEHKSGSDWQPRADYCVLVLIIDVSNLDKFDSWFLLLAGETKKLRAQEYYFIEYFLYKEFLFIILMTLRLKMFIHVSTSKCPYKTAFFLVLVLEIES